MVSNWELMGSTSKPNPDIIMTTWCHKNLPSSARYENSWFLILKRLIWQFYWGFLTEIPSWIQQKIPNMQLFTPQIYKLHWTSAGYLINIFIIGFLAIKVYAIKLIAYTFRLPGPDTAQPMTSRQRDISRSKVGGLTLDILGLWHIV